MKYLKKFNESVEDPDFIMAKIKEQFPYDVVKEMFDKEVNEWTPDGEDDTWYERYGNGEAQDVVITDLIGWVEKKYDDEIPDSGLPNNLYELIEKEYDFLNID